MLRLTKKNRSSSLIAGLALVLVLSGVTQARNIDLTQPVSLTLEEMPLNSALNMLAVQYQLNMVVADVGAVQVSLFLDDVSLKDALEALLYPNGFSFYERGNVLVITTGKDSDLGGMRTLYYRLKYAPADMAKTAIEAIKSQFGAVNILTSTDQESKGTSVAPRALMIHDFPAIIEKAQQLLDQMDKSERMVMIEVKMVETKIDASNIIGFNWPKSVGINVRDQQTTSSTSTTTSTDQNNSRAGYLDLPDGKFTWGTLNVEELTATLDFLQTNGKSKLVSNPRLATLENHRATFKVATVVPVQTINRFTEGAATSDIVTFQDIEVGIELEVTPRINEDGVITMDVFPKVEEIIGFSGTADQQKPITTERSVRTVVTCTEGETVVIGGLLRENEITDEEKIFLLGDVPILGGLFKHKRKETENTDLLIMITPTVLNATN